MDNDTSKKPPATSTGEPQGLTSKSANVRSNSTWNVAKMTDTNWTTGSLPKRRSQLRNLERPPDSENSARVSR